MVGALVAIVALPIYLSQQFGAMSASVKASFGDAVAWVSAKFQGVLDFLGGISLVEIGKNIIMGLAGGITGAGGAVLSAVTGVVGGAVDGAKSLLQINSPSKVFAAIGASTGEGMVAGVDDGAADVRSALETMVAPPATQSGGSTTNTTTSTGGSTVYQITIQGGGDAGSNLSAFRDWLEGLGAQAGTAVPT